MGPPTRVMCECREPAELLRVKKEGPRKGRLFWKCTEEVQLLSVGIIGTGEGRSEESQESQEEWDLNTKRMAECDLDPRLGEGGDRSFIG